MVSLPAEPHDTPWSFNLRRFGEDFACVFV
jgi:hypothetical protein